MSGVSDVAFRTLCKRHGAAMTYTEFCSADGIVRGNIATLKQFYISPEESPVGIQLFGSSPETVKDAALLAQKTASVVDFNLGCPAWHVLSQGCGSALLQDPDQVERIVRDVASVLDKPFTVKLRLGIDDRRRNFIEVARRCVEAGAVAVALHGRTTKQGYGGTADWDAIRDLKRAVDVPVIGNGDVFSAEDAVRMLEHTGCDYVMIGRGARNDPFIFTQANDLLETGRYGERSDSDKLALFFEYLELAKRFELDFIRIKTHAMSLSKGVAGARHIRGRLTAAQSLEELEDAVRPRTETI